MITQLTVFNSMIATMGFMPYATEEAAATNPYWAQAIEILTLTSRRVQTRGWWFNTTYFDVDPVAGVEFPCAILRIQGPGIDGLVIRGTGVYNMRAQETQATLVRGVKAVVELAWEDLPPIAQDYLYARAVLAFQAEYDSTQSTSDRWTDQVRESWVLMNTEDIKAKRANRILSLSVLAAIAGQRGQSQGGRTFYQY
jgi:hypothetical protein